MPNRFFRSEPDSRRRWLCRGVCLALLYGYIPPVQAGTSGYAEYSATYDDNYNMASEPADRIPETMQAFGVTLIHSQPVSRKTSLLLTGGFRYVSYSRFSDLSGTTYYLNGGVYHRTSYLRSFSFLLGGYRKKIRNALQDEGGYSARFSPTQRLSPLYWLSEQLFYEKGTAEHLADNYRSYGLGVRMNRLVLKNQSWVAAALTAAKKSYDDYFSRDISAYQIQLEWTYPIRKQFYVRTAGFYTLAQSGNHFDYRSRMVALAVGYEF